MLKRPAAALAMALTVVTAVLATAACDRAPSVRPARSGPAEPTVAASWLAADGSVFAVNLVVAVGTDTRVIRDLAERERAVRPGARVIVRVYAATAGRERYVIGHVPSRDEPLNEGSHPPSLLGIYDFPA